MEEETEAKRFQPVYIGTGSDIFLLVFKTGMLTVLTLGIYRFWAKTRVRRYVWSSVKINGDVAEYTGTGLEKFLGFLVAVVVLAIYLGLLQVILTFAGLNMMGAFTEEPTTQQEIIQQLAAIYISFAAILPLLYFAQYRSRRYMLSRTRWRGLRLGMTPGAIGFTWRALLYLTLSIVTLGLLTPLMTFRLQKYMVDRQWFGDAKFQQNGKWTGLYKAMKHIGIALLIGIAAGVIGALGTPTLGVILGVVAYVWFFIAVIDYRVKAYQYLTQNQTLDGHITFAAAPKTSDVVTTYLVGGLLVGLLSAAVFIPLGLIAESTMSSALGGSFGMVVLAFVIYMAGLVAIAAGSAALITQPILAHFVSTTSIDNAEHFDAIQQRADDSIPDADGFADALDVGAAF